MDVIEINPEEVEINEMVSPTLRLDNDSDNDDFMPSKPSVNFGSGIELLMNDKTKNDKKSSSNVEIDDITKLEDELNNLSAENDEMSSAMDRSSSKKPIFGGLFGVEKTDGSNVRQVSGNEEAKEQNLGKSTSDLNENKTWDGYGKFNNVPVNLDKVDKKPELSKEEELKEKFKYIRRLEDLEKKGVSLSKRYNMDSDLQEMIGEYETIIAEKEKSNSVKFQAKMMMACVTGLEFLNNKFDPFDIKLDGWSEQLNENIEEYDEIFGELHEKYKSKAKMSPELKLLFQLGGSAIMVHMSNTLFKSSMPGMDDIFKQNPELMKQFTSAAVNTMGNNGNPGFAGFMNNVFAGGQGGPGQGGGGNDSGLGFGPSMRREPPPNVNEGPPPAPMETKLPERSQRTQNIPNRPDIMSARGVSISENQGSMKEPEQRITRPEMRGPSAKQNEITNLLSGLKTKQVSVPEAKQNNEASTISVEDLKELTGARFPKSKRKQKSDKNIVSLDI
tara:strand:- start:1217 stop:2722 length:1506 start_codon:yes stop_codon:yes gene_type:complete